MSSHEQSLVGLSETDPLLPSRSSVIVGAHEPADGAALHTGDLDETNGESYDAVPLEKRQIGLFSAVFLVFNRVIGTGIYATPSLILQSCGSVGMSLLMWILGALIAAAGTAVYIELGTGLPRSGGEKNYLEFIFRKPKFLVSCVYAMYAVLIGHSAAGAVVFGEYLIHALALPITTVNVRAVGALSLTAAFMLHSTALKWGLRIQNSLGVFILLVMSFIAIAGVVVLAFPGLSPNGRTDNLQWSRMWEGTRIEANAFVTGLYNVIWSFIGYSNTNYVLSEVRDPVRTIKRAAPLAMLSVAIVYMLVNIAYFAVVSKEDIIGGGRVVAALFFRNLFGSQTERLVSVIIALSVFGNTMAVLFTHGLVQELGREGILPYSAWFASNRPFNSPFTGLFEQWFVCVVIAVAPPPGDAFNFILQLSSYTMSLINLSVSAGLLFLHTRWAKSWGWEPPFTAWLPATIFYVASNMFLAVVPLIPSKSGFTLYENLPYWLHVAVCLAIALAGATYWYVWCVILPRRGGYALVRELVIQGDGISRNTFRKQSID